MKFIGRAVVAVAAAGLAVGSVIGGGTANAATYHGAIAFSVGNWSYGTSINAVSREQAIEEALASCARTGGSDCVVQEVWADGCGALIYTTDPKATWWASSGVGPNRAAALAAAHNKLAPEFPRALLANVGSADKSGTAVSTVLCTATSRG